MTVDERRRAELFDRLSEALGDEAAGTMFEMLPPPDRELATTHDVERLGVALRGEMSELRTELRVEMSELRTELRGEMGELRGQMTAMRADMQAMRHELVGAIHAEINRAFVSQTRIIVFALIAALAAIAALAVGVG